MFRAGSQYYWELRENNESLHDVYERIKALQLNDHLNPDRRLAHAAAVSAVMFDGSIWASRVPNHPTTCTPVSFFFSTLMIDHTGDEFVPRAGIGMRVSC